MRVALLSRSAHPLHPPGGMEKAVFDLARALHGCGAEVVLFTRPPTRDGAFPGSVEVVPYGSTRGVAHGRVLDRTLHYPAFSHAVGKRVAERVRRREIDVVYAQGLAALGYGRARRREPAQLRAPLVMNPQGMEEHKATGLKRLALARLRALSREAARLSDRVVATDDATRAEVPLLLGVDPGKVVVLPNGIDLAAVDAVTPANPLAYADAALPALRGAHPLLLSVGRIERYKGFEDVLAALVALRDASGLPDGFAWAVVGDGPRRRALAEQAARAGLLGTRFDAHALGVSSRGGRPCVHLLGRVDEPLLHALYARADLFAHAAHFEGSSLVTLEAMAHGLPVVATRAGGIPDKVEDGSSGRLVEPRDVAALARALEALLGDAAARRRMGERGREIARLRFSWAAIARRHLRLFEELLGEGRP